MLVNLLPGTRSYLDLEALEIDELSDLEWRSLAYYEFAYLRTYIPEKSRGRCGVYHPHILFACDRLPGHPGFHANWRMYPGPNEEIATVWA